MITYAILILTVAFSLYAMDRPEIKHKYIFHPYSINHGNQHYRFLSHAFLHADYIHLAFNMFALLSFGPTVEKVIMPSLAGSYEEPNYALGSVYYIILYTGAIYAASLTEYFKNKNNKYYSSLGASGAINAVIFSYILCLPRSTLSMFFIRDIPAWIFGLLFLGISYYLSKRKLANDNVGHEAHFWGAVFGLVFTGVLKPELFSSFIKQILP